MTELSSGSVYHRSIVRLWKCCRQSDNNWMGQKYFIYRISENRISPRQGWIVWERWILNLDSTSSIISNVAFKQSKLELISMDDIILYSIYDQVVIIWPGENIRKYSDKGRKEKVLLYVEHFGAEKEKKSLWRCSCVTWFTLFCLKTFSSYLVSAAERSYITGVRKRTTRFKEFLCGI